MIGIDEALDTLLGTKIGAEIGSNRGKTHDQHVEDLEKANSPYICIGEYKTSKKRVRYQCKVCKTETEIFPFSAIDSPGCKACRAEAKAQAKACR